MRYVRQRQTKGEKNRGRQVFRLREEKSKGDGKKGRK